MIQYQRISNYIQIFTSSGGQVYIRSLKVDWKSVLVPQCTKHCSETQHTLTTHGRLHQLPLWENWKGQLSSIVLCRHHTFNTSYPPLTVAELGCCRLHPLNPDYKVSRKLWLLTGAGMRKGSIIVWYDMGVVCLHNPRLALDNPSTLQMLLLEAKVVPT